MNNTLHTPGPWESMGFYISARNQKLPLPNTQTIARVFPEHETVGGNTLANARLIASAPDLLGICEEIANDSKCDLVQSDRRIRLYSAIRKAKGEA